MKILHWQEVPGQKMDHAEVKGITGRVLIGSKDGAGNFCMRLFEIEEGGHTPRHKHDWEHEIFVHSGHGEVYYDGEWIPVTTGNSVFIRPNLEHQIRNTGIDKLVFVCLIPKGPPEL